VFALQLQQLPHEIVLDLVRQRPAIFAFGRSDMRQINLQKGEKL
jgi:hypothetical protein